MDGSWITVCRPKARKRMHMRTENGGNHWTLDTISGKQPAPKHFQSWKKSLFAQITTLQRKQTALHHPPPSLRLSIHTKGAWQLHAALFAIGFNRFNKNIVMNMSIKCFLAKVNVQTWDWPTWSSAKVICHTKIFIRRYMKGRKVRVDCVIIFFMLFGSTSCIFCLYWPCFWKAPGSNSFFLLLSEFSSVKCFFPSNLICWLWFSYGN